jgi:Autotransporter beta-domain
MRKHILPASESSTTVLYTSPHRASPRSWHHRFRVFDATRRAFWSAALLSAAALLAGSPAAAQFACTVTATDSTCTNTGNATVFENNIANGAGQNATTSNSGTAVGFESATSGGGDATATNSGTNNGTGLIAVTQSGGNATATNSGTNTGGIEVVTEGGGTATATNSGRNTNGIVVFTTAGGDATATNSGTNNSFGIVAQTTAGGNATVTNSGSNFGGMGASALGGGNATAINSGSSSGGISASTTNGNATANNSGGNFGNILVSATSGSATAINSGNNVGALVAQVQTGNATAVNSGSNSFGITSQTNTGNATAINSGNNSSGIDVSTALGNTTVINSGTTNGTLLEQTLSGTATLTNIVGGRVIGGIELIGTTGAVNFLGGNWLFTFATIPVTTAFNTNGAPFVVSGNQVAVLDLTSFALADRALTNFTGEVQQMLQGRFDGMAAAGGGGDGAALGFAGAPSTPGIADQATQAFSGIPSVAMSYASNPRPLLGKAAAAPYYDTTIWASGFGGERKQNADGVVLPATDIAYGGALGIDRAFGPNLRLGAFAGGGASREDVELSVQSINSTYAFGGGYGRFDWATQYLDFSLYGGGITNSSTRQVANNTVASGLETATASYGGWFISPALSYGYRIPFANNIVMTPRVSVRYVGGALDGYSESGSEQDLSVGRRSINDLEERAELEFSTLKPISSGGTVKTTVSVGAIGLERLGNQTIDTVLLGQNLSFITPGQASAVGGVVDAGIQYHPVGNVSLFVSGEATAMSDRSYSGAATGGMRVSF